MIELQTSRLHLTPITLEDQPALAALWSDPLVTRYLPGGEPYAPATVQAEVEGMAAHWQQHGYGMFGVRWQGKPELLGYCGFQQLHVGPGGISAEAAQRWGSEIEIAYGLAQAAWGQGVASEAATACQHLAFQGLRLPRLAAAIHPENHASGRILQDRLGMRPAPEMDFYGQCPHFVITSAEAAASAPAYTLLSDDAAWLDVDAVCALLGKAYWASQRTRAAIERSIQHSMNFGLYAAKTDGYTQVGFCRVVTDRVTFAWLCDVFIDETQRGRGLGKWLAGAPLRHPELRSMRRWLLATRDAHGLYRQHGFVELNAPERWMEKFNPDV